MTSPARDADQPLGGDVEDAPLHGHQFLDRDHLEIEHVDQDVDHRDRAGAERQRQRQVPPGIAHLFRHVGGGVPARIDEHHDDQAEQPSGGVTAPARRRRATAVDRSRPGRRR
jgi:hypothetical protein